MYRLERRRRNDPYQKCINRVYSNTNGHINADITLFGCYANFAISFSCFGDATSLRDILRTSRYKRCGPLGLTAGPHLTTGTKSPCPWSTMHLA